jgi:hypothetical protein
VTISGEVVSISTTPGQSAADIAAALAAQINARAPLQALRVVATALGSLVVVEAGDVTSVLIADAGLTAPLELFVWTDRLTWSYTGAPAGADVIRGSLNAAWSQQWDFSSAAVTQSCLADNESLSMLMTSESLAIGAGIWYLVRPAGGSWDSGDPAQVGSRDAGIAASGNACP